MRTLIDALLQLLRSVGAGNRGTGTQPGNRSGNRSGTRSGGRRGSSGRRLDPQTVPNPTAGHGAPAADAASTSGDRIEYSPCLDGDPDPGEVVWTWVPYEEDPSQGKDRPVVIIGRRGTHLLGVPLTSKQHDNEAQVEVGTGSWDSADRVSYAKVERLLDVDPDKVRREGAILSRQRFDAVVAGVQAAHRR